MGYIAQKLTRASIAPFGDLSKNARRNDPRNCAGGFFSKKCGGRKFTAEYSTAGLDLQAQAPYL
jgi:hypothetical protein